jgi:hypothetical protein
MIRDFDRDAFERTLRETLSPTTPIRTPQFLRGRDNLLEGIRRAFLQPGRMSSFMGIGALARHRWRRRQRFSKREVTATQSSLAATMHRRSMERLQALFANWPLLILPCARQLPL